MKENDGVRAVHSHAVVIYLLRVTMLRKLASKREIIPNRQERDDPTLAAIEGEQIIQWRT
jgi:hypothetical protein